MLTYQKQEGFSSQNLDLPNTDLCQICQIQSRLLRRRCFRANSDQWASSRNRVITPAVPHLLTPFPRNCLKSISLHIITIVEGLSSKSRWQFEFLSTLGYLSRQGYPSCLSSLKLMKLKTVTTHTLPMLTYSFSYAFYTTYQAYFILHLLCLLHLLPSLCRGSLKA